MEKRKDFQPENSLHEAGEDATKYGEFVSSYFAWIPPNYQKEKAKKLQNMTKNNEQKNEN